APRPSPFVEDTVSIDTTTNVPEDLRSRVRGRVIGPDDADYESSRTIVSGEYALHPAAIVRVADGADVAAVISAARELGLEIAVRSGGPRGAGHPPPRGGVGHDRPDLD